MAFLVIVATPMPAQTIERLGVPWSGLTESQQIILDPLKSMWQTMDAKRRQKWLDIARRYQRVDSIARQRLSQRMLKWALLSQEQRQVARAKYRSFAELPADKRRAVLHQWLEYEAYRARQQNQVSASTSR